MFWCGLSHGFLSQLIDELEVLVNDPQEGQKHQEELMNLQELVHHKQLLITEEILKVSTIGGRRAFGQAVQGFFAEMINSLFSPLLVEGQCEHGHRDGEHADRGEG